MDIKKYKYKTELHAHTSPASGCAELSPDEVIRRYAEKGYHSIVISNHLFSSSPNIKSSSKEEFISFYLNDYCAAQEAGNKYGINVILGCEIRFDENFNDYLLFGIDEDFISEGYDFLQMSLAEFSKNFRRNGRLLIQAHPFRNNMTEIPPEYLDGIEVFNMHPGHNSRIAFAAAYAHKNNLIKTCGTDFHHPGHEGIIALLTENELKTSHDIVAALNSRRYLFEISGSIIIP